MSVRPSPAAEIKELLAALLPPGQDYRPVIPAEQQEGVIRQAAGNIPNETFYFVFNLLTGELENVQGVDLWLGYPNKEFNFEKYMNCIHPAQVLLHQVIASGMYRVLCNGTFRLQFNRQRYISNIGLRHHNGEYYNFKKTTSIFQHDGQHRMLAQLNEFTKIGAYDGEAIKPRIAEMDSLQREAFEQSFSQLALKQFMEKKYFSRKEFEVLRCQALHETLNNRQLAAMLGVAPPTLDTFNKRILAKARKTFTYPFQNAREVAVYLKKARILSLP